MEESRCHSMLQDLRSLRAWQGRLDFSTETTGGRNARVDRVAEAELCGEMAVRRERCWDVRVRDETARLLSVSTAPGLLFENMCFNRGSRADASTSAGALVADLSLDKHILQDVLSKKL